MQSGPRNNVWNSLLWGCFHVFLVLFYRCFAMIDNSSFENTSELDSTTMKADQRHSLEGMMGMGVASTFHAILMQSSPKIFQVKFCLIKMWISMETFCYA